MCPISKIGPRGSRLVVVQVGSSFVFAPIFDFLHCIPRFICKLAYFSSFPLSLRLKSDHYCQSWRLQMHVSQFNSRDKQNHSIWTRAIDSEWRIIPWYNFIGPYLTSTCAGAGWVHNKKKLLHVKFAYACAS